MLVALATAAPAQAKPGDLDPRFGGGDGTFEVLSPSAPFLLNPMIAQALDGTIALAGTRFMPPDSQGIVYRVAPNGGTAVPAEPLNDFELGDVAFQADGKILVAGTASDHFAVARFRADGELDSAYAGDGVYESAPGLAVEIALDPDGRAVVAGVGGPSNQVRVERISQDGSLLGSYAAGASNSLASSVAVQDDGRILVGGFVDSQPMLVRLTPALVPDPAFAPTLAQLAYISDIAVKSDGRIVVGTFSPPTAMETDPVRVFAQMLPDGSFDPKFRAFTLRTIDGPYNVQSLATDSGGRIVFAGDFLGRALPGGALDPSFAAGGLERSIVGNTDLKLQADGKLLLAHHASDSTGGLAVSRYLGGSVRCGGRKLTRVGTPNRDTIRGTKRRDVIAALGGSDRVLGRGGNDAICGGGGRDRLIGGAGRDRLLGGKGNDILLGGKGRDSERQ